MVTVTENVIPALNRLIGVCRDGEKGFQAAAQALEGDVELADLCLRYSQKRAEFAAELQEEVRKLSGNPEEKGTLTGALHRGWMNMKALVTGGDEDVIIAECEEAEDETESIYEETLALYLPEALTKIIQKQYAEVKEVHHRFRSLKKSAR